MKIFVLGNGPSLKYQGLLPGMPNHDGLSKEITIGVNWIEAPTADVDINVDYLVWTDTAAYAGQHSGIDGRSLLTDTKARRYAWQHHEDIEVDFPYTYFGKFPQGFGSSLSEYIEDGLCRNGSCIFSALNLAYILGGNPIILLGTDFDTRDGYLHFYDEEKTEVTFEDTRAKLDQGTKGNFEALAPELEALGISVYNATEGGLLEGYPRITLAEALELPDETGPRILYEPILSHLRDMKERAARVAHESHKLGMRWEALGLWEGKDTDERCHACDEALWAINRDGIGSLLDAIDSDSGGLLDKYKIVPSQPGRIGTFSQMMQVKDFLDRQVRWVPDGGEVHQASVTRKDITIESKVWGNITMPKTEFIRILVGVRLLDNDILRTIEGD